METAGSTGKSVRRRATRAEASAARGGSSGTTRMVMADSEPKSGVRVDASGWSRVGSGAAARVGWVATTSDTWAGVPDRRAG